jgi:hypothetical protein
MGNYNLTGLSSRSFEHLVQALACKIFGPATTVFGDGPDGGREATFEGKATPDPPLEWEGYTVIQAKFRQRSSEKVDDKHWAGAQLSKEFEAFVKPGSNRRSPEYYVFATNVVLSGASGSGGKDFVAEVIERYSSQLPLKGSMIWDYVQLSAFLDLYSDIRMSNAAFITAGDVLSMVIESANFSRPDFGQVMASFLARELLGDQFANLEQAGHAVEDRIPLARVFVDLPTTEQRVSEPPLEDNIEELVSALIGAARDRLKPSMLSSELSKSGEKSRPPSKLAPGRFVLVGGPGQGKTTVGQFACQLFRAAILTQRRTNQLSAEVRDTLAAIKSYLAEIGLDLPAARRFPVRLALGELSVAVAENDSITLLEHVSHRIRSQSGYEVSVGDLRKWLSCYPWLLVLDGLDEVAVSSNRSAVLRKIEDFWIDAAQLDADVLVLATTRPQGYSDDFSPLYYRHLYLAPLSSDRAIIYGRRLAKIRYGGDVERQELVVSRLQKAARAEATARLMRSPLQVTIMAALVDQIGDPPQDRWRLFHDYYEVIYRREQARDIPAAVLLRDRRADIDAIHHRVGLVLQLESEKVESADASLDSIGFASLVEARLREEGHEGEGLSKLKEDVIDAAANRLVFLVAPRQGRVGFEIRSLQEYMAAEALMSGSERSVRLRLRRVASVPVWRNTMLFAAGRCFSQPQSEHFRDTIYTICAELNEDTSDRLAPLTLPGSQLALDLLEDGVGRRQPKFARLFARLAAELVYLPPSELHHRLADICEAEVGEVIRKKVEIAVVSQGLDFFGGWATLCFSARNQTEWVANTAESAWPIAEPDREEELLASEFFRSLNEVVPRTVDAALSRHPVRASAAFGRAAASYPARFTFLRLLRGDGGRSLFNFRLNTRSSFLTFGLAGLEEARRVSGRYGRITTKVQLNCHFDWIPTFEAIRFDMKPSADRLAMCLRRVAEVWRERVPMRFVTQGSWVFRSCLGACDTVQDLSRIAGAAEDGSLGSAADWLEAEARWARQGVTLEDLIYTGGSALPFDAEIKERGFPIAGVTETSYYPAPVREIVKLLRSIDGAPAIQRKLLWILTSTLEPHLAVPPRGLTPEWMTELLEGRSDYDLGEVVTIASWALEDSRWLSLIPFYSTLEGRRWGGVDVSPLVELARRYPDEESILVLLASALLAGGVIEVGRLPRVGFKRGESRDRQRAGFIIGSVRGSQSVKSAIDLAQTALNRFPGEIKMFTSVLELVQRFGRLDSPAAAFIAEMVEGIEMPSREFRSVAAAAANEVRRHRSSSLADDRVWDSLDLPPGLWAVTEAG